MGLRKKFVGFAKMEWFIIYIKYHKIFTFNPHTLT